MRKSVGVGDVIALKSSYITDKYYIPKGTKFKVIFVDEGSSPYFCRCMTMTITIWLKRDQFDCVGRDFRRRYDVYD